MLAEISILVKIRGITMIIISVECIYHRLVWWSQAWSILTQSRSDILYFGIRAELWTSKNHFVIVQSQRHIQSIRAIWTLAIAESFSFRELIESRRFETSRIEEFMSWPSVVIVSLILITSFLALNLINISSVYEGVKSNWNTPILSAMKMEFDW